MGFHVVSGLSGEYVPSQVNTLLYIMDENGENIFESFGFSSAESKSLKAVVKNFYSSFTPAKNLIYMFYTHST